MPPRETSFMATDFLPSSPAAAKQLGRTPFFSIPLSAGTPSGFRDWAFSPSFPQGVRGTLVDGNILIDMTSEHLDTHNFVKLEVTSVLYSLVRSKNLGCSPPMEPCSRMRRWDCRASRMLALSLMQVSKAAKCGA